MKLFKFLLTIIVILIVTSCTRQVRNGMRVVKVQDSGNIETPYMVFLDSDTEDGIVYYTKYKYEVGDTLASINEFKIINKERVDKYQKIIDSLAIENNKLKYNIDELKMFNSLLIRQIKDSIINK